MGLIEIRGVERGADLKLILTMSVGLFDNEDLLLYACYEFMVLLYVYVLNIFGIVTHPALTNWFIHFGCPMSTNVNSHM